MPNIQLQNPIKSILEKRSGKTSEKIKGNNGSLIHPLFFLLSVTISQKQK